MAELPKKLQEREFSNTRSPALAENLTQDDSERSLCTSGPIDRLGKQKTPFWPTRKFWNAVSKRHPSEWDTQIFLKSPLVAVVVVFALPGIYGILVELGLLAPTRLLGFYLSVASIAAMLLMKAVKGIMEHIVRKELSQREIDRASCELESPDWMESQDSDTDVKIKAPD